MKAIRMPFVVLLILISIPYADAQEKQGSQTQEVQPTALPIPLKVQFLVTQYDGENKITSLPYTATTTTSQTGKRDSQGSLRAGARIPIATGALTVAAGGTASPQVNTQFQYIDVGTNIDFWVWQWSDNRYLVAGNLELSSLLGKNDTNEPKGSATAEPTPPENPVVHAARGFFSVALHDGQSAEAIAITDPLTGHVFKVEVTLNVLK